MKRKVRNVLSVSAKSAIIVGVVGFGLYNYYEEHGTLDPYDDDSKDSKTTSDNLIIARNYGQTILKKEDVKITEGDTIRDVLDEECDVRYSYGGGFVEEIDGLASDFPTKYLDWFFFINGYIADVGLLEYDLQLNDKILWDYHDWSYDNLMWSCIFNDPIRTIKYGYEGETADVLICYENSSYQPIAFDLKNYLQNEDIDDITIKEDNFVSSSDLADNNVLLIGSYSMSYMEDFYDEADNAGLFAYLKSDTEVERIENGDGTPPNDFTVAETYQPSDNISLINIAQNMFSPNSIGNPSGKVCIAFSGLDLQSIISGVQLFIDEDDVFDLSYGVLIEDGDVKALPF